MPLQWHLKQRLAPLFAAQAEALTSNALQAKDRILTLAGLLETLKSQRRNQVSIGGASFQQVSEPTPEIKIILDLLTLAPLPMP